MRSKAGEQIKRQDVEDFNGPLGIWNQSISNLNHGGKEWGKKEQSLEGCRL